MRPLPISNSLPSSRATKLEGIDGLAMSQSDDASSFVLSAWLGSDEVHVAAAAIRMILVSVILICVRREGFPGIAETIHPPVRGEDARYHHRLPALRACFKIPWGPVFGEKAGWRGATRAAYPPAICDRGATKVVGVRKPSGRRVFCLRPALTRPSQPAAGMLRPRRLGHSQNPSTQDPTQF